MIIFCHVLIIKYLTQGQEMNKNQSMPPRLRLRAESEELKQARERNKELVELCERLYRNHGHGSWDDACEIWGEVLPIIRNGGDEG